MNQQQKHIIESKTELLVDQDKEIEGQASQIKKLKERMQQKEEEPKTRIEDPKDVINVDDNDDDSVATKIKQEKPSTSGTGPIKLEEIFKKEALARWIPGYKAPTSSEGSSTSASQIPSQPTSTDVPPPSTNVYLPQPSKDQNVVLLQPTQQNVKTTERRSGKTHPVPEGRRSKHKVYCEKCKSSFSRKDQLQQHIKNDCLQPI